MTSQLGLRGLSCVVRTSPHPHSNKHKPGDSPSPVPGISARNIFLHTWNLKSSEMTGNWISSRAGGGDSARIFCSLGAGTWGQVCVWKDFLEEAWGRGRAQGVTPKRGGLGCGGGPGSLVCHSWLKPLSEFPFGRMRKF